MTKIEFTDAVRERIPLLMFLDGPTGSGKTYTMLAALKAAQDHGGGEIAVIDTENSSTRLYAGGDGPFPGFKFKHFDFRPPYHPDRLVEVIQAAVAQGFTGIGLDSWSHFWTGEGGTLALHDQHTSASRGNSFAAWQKTNPIYFNMLNAIAQCPIHFVVTARSKMTYEQGTDEKGKSRVAKVGLQPVMRDAAEYEFTIVGDMTEEHTLVIGKSRIAMFADKVEKKPSPEFFLPLYGWLDGGAEPAPPPPARATAAGWNRIRVLANDLQVSVPDLQKHILDEYDAAKGSDLNVDQIAEIEVWLRNQKTQETAPEPEPEPGAAPKTGPFDDMGDELFGDPTQEEGTT